MNITWELVSLTHHEQLREADARRVARLIDRGAARPGPRLRFAGYVRSLVSPRPACAAGTC